MVRAATPGSPGGEIMIGDVRWPAAVFAVLTMLPAALSAADLPEWAAMIRRDHPRLFFNAETWPAVRDRALGAEASWYGNVKGRVDKLLADVGPQERPEPRDLGSEASWAAFVFLMTEDEGYLNLARKCLDTSLRYYDACFEAKKAVNWYSTSRVHATLAWDWLYNHLAPEERAGIFSRLVQAVNRVLTAKPPIYRENISGYTTGYYGVNNCCWFLGCTGLGTGIETELVEQWLVKGHDEFLKMLAHRRDACGDDGGGASATLGYVFGAYPWAEQNFLYTWLSATGQNIAGDWPHAAWLANYVLWNWISAEDGPLAFGFGDGDHTSNRLPTWQLYTHMANIRHLYADAAPQAAALARYLQDIVPERQYSMSWFVYPFLLSGLDRSPEPLTPEGLPSARHFETMGQVFMRSGTGPDDTYCLFTCGGALAQHRHYDALNFVIYHRGYLALDSGTRYEEFKNGQHLANYYAQTVAHNCVVIHQPGEPPASYWGGKVEGNHGGQHKQLGSVVRAFQTNEDLVYVAGDATACYQHKGAKAADGTALPQKCVLATRQLLFIMPNHFVIFDRVTTTDASYRKEWLLHTADEPMVSGNVTRADHGQGRLLCRTLLPADAQLTTVGGPGKEFWAAGRNWDIVTGNLKPENLALMGRWRLEVAPDSPRTEDVFLHVIQVGDQSLETMDACELVETEATRGLRLHTGDATWEVTFAASGDLGGHIRRIGGVRPLDEDLSTEVTPQSGIMADGQ